MQGQKRPRPDEGQPQQGRLCGLPRATCDHDGQQEHIPTGDSTPGDDLPPQQQHKQLRSIDPVQLPTPQAALQQQPATATAKAPQPAAQQPQQAPIKGSAGDPAGQQQPAHSSTAPPAATGGFRLQPGQVLELQSLRQVGFDLCNLQPTGEQWQLQVQRPLGAGASAEAYEVAVLTHNPATASPFVPGIEAPQRACLKVPRQYTAVPNGMRQTFYKTPDHLLARSILSFQEQHRVMRLCSSSSCSSVPVSYGFGCIEVGVQDEHGGSGSSSSRQQLPALLTELGSSGSLEQLIGAEGWGAEQCRPVMRSVALALQQLHAAGYVHLDLKPANCTCSGSSSSSAGFSTGALATENLYKLIDYGSVFTLGQRSRAVLHSGITGTAGFMAPELYPTQYGGGEISYAADIYGLGALLVDMRLGHTRNPLPGLTPEQVATGKALAAVQASPLWAQLEADEQQLISSCLRAYAMLRPSIQQLLALPYFVGHAAPSGASGDSAAAQQQDMSSTGGSGCGQAAGGAAAGGMQQSPQPQQQPLTAGRLQPNSQAVLRTQRLQATDGSLAGTWVADGGEMSLTVGEAVGSNDLYDFYSVTVTAHKLPGPAHSSSQQCTGNKQVDQAGKKRWLKVPKPYATLSPGLQQFVQDAEAHTSTFLQQEHLLLTQQPRANPLVLKSWGFGEVQQGGYSCCAMLLDAADALLTASDKHAQALLGGVGCTAVGAATAKDIVRKVLLGLARYNHAELVLHSLRPGNVVAHTFLGAQSYKLTGGEMAGRLFKRVSPQLRELLGRTYACPELQSDDCESLSQHDVWSLGMFLLELRTGLPPFAHLALLPAAEAMDRYRKELFCPTGLYSDLAGEERRFVSDCLALSQSPIGHHCPDLEEVAEHEYFKCNFPAAS